MPAMPDSGTIALEQLGLLNNQFSNLTSPFNQYGQNLLTLAIDRRRREQQLADLASTRAFETSQTKQQQDFSLRLQNAQVAAADQRQKAEWDHAEKVKQADLLREAESEAARLGIDTSQIGGDERTKYFAIQTKLNAAHSESITALIQRGAALHKQLTALTGVDPQRVDQLAKQQLLQDPEVARAFAADLPDIQNNSANIAKIISRLSASRSAADKEKLALLVSKWNGAQTAAELEIAKLSPHREQVELIKDQLATQRMLLSSQLKGTDLTASTIGAMLGGTADEVDKVKQEQADPRAAWFNRTINTGQAVAPAIKPPAVRYRQPGFLSRVAPAIGEAASAITSPIRVGARFARAGVDQLLGDITGAPTYPTQWYTNPEAAGSVTAPVFAPTSPTTPSSQGTYSLLNWLMRNQNQRAFMTPLSAPPAPVAPLAPLPNPYAQFSP